MIKFWPLDILGVSHRIPWKNQNTVYGLQISALVLNIVNIEYCLWSPANNKKGNIDGEIFVGRSTTVHNPLFCPHTLCINYVNNTFLLVSFSERSKPLLYFVHRQGQKSEQKHKTKNFVEFHNHPPLLTMFWRYLSLKNVLNMQMRWLRTSYTQLNIISGTLSYLGQFAA